MNERNFPHIVELPLPRDGFGKTLAEFDAFNRARRIEMRRGRSRSRPLDGQYFCRWCFADAETAEEFQTKFGGILMKGYVPRRSR